MEFIVGFTIVWAGLHLMKLFGIGEEKPAKNYKELMKRDAFRIDGTKNE